MPIYEYYCDACARASSFLLLRASESIEPFCKACGSRDVRRILSRVSVLKSEEQRMESLLDPSKFSDLDENDPGSIERAMRRMGREMGDELGEDFQETVDEAIGAAAGSSSDEL
ncbi:MAG TPA: zinc ribbon domain-containing protein [Syntrophorhabdaceae bacterium]|jgi:putative FmdB family regulatory protein